MNRKGRRRKRIGIDARILQLPRRGQGQYLYYLIKHLTRIDQEHEYLLFYNGFHKGSTAFASEPDSAGLAEVWNRLPGGVLNTLWSRLNLPAIEQLIGELDLFHNPFNFNFTYYTPVPSRCPMVVTFNGMADPATIWDRYDPAPIERWFELIAQRAARVIAVSESVKDDLLRRGFDEERLRVIHYGVGEEFRPLDDPGFVQQVLTKHGLTGKRYILYVGAAEKNKNLEGLLCVFAELLRSLKTADLYLVLVGSIDQAYQRIREAAEKLGVSHRVIMPGYIGHDQLPALYNGAQLFVLASFHEWFGIPLLEAMACGVPVVASDSRGVPEVVGEAGILCSPHDSAGFVAGITSVLMDRQRALSLREKGLKRVEGFRWVACARKTLAVYQEALSGGV